MSAWAACRASPSLALLKYWGKLDGEDNLPATPSLAVTLGGLYTDTWVRPAPEDSMHLDGAVQEAARYTRFFDRLRTVVGVTHGFEARSRNSFPTAAGLASSSSGFAALAGACVRAAARELAASEISAIAREGSASAARSIFGGFVFFPAGARSAAQLFGDEHWPSLRVIVAVTRRAEKPLSSREAMRRTASTSPFYAEWVEKSQALVADALAALEKRDLEKIGELVRASSSMMHATMLAARPPILYWLPETLAVMHACSELRRGGTGAWETIDAGPQVKILCEAQDGDKVIRAVKESAPEVETLTCFPGQGIKLGAAEEPGA
ncbi:MAG: diphosphomevalonate decarboxylase [Spirochaetia bacterium]